MTLLLAAPSLGWLQMYVKFNGSSDCWKDSCPAAAVAGTLLSALVARWLLYAKPEGLADRATRSRVD